MWLVSSLHPLPRLCSGLISWRSVGPTFLNYEFISGSIWRYMQTMEMKVRHIHAGAVHADLRKTPGHLVAVFQLNHSTRHRPYHGRNFMTFKDKCSLTCCRIVDSPKLE